MSIHLAFAATAAALALSSCVQLGSETSFANRSAGASQAQNAEQAQGANTESNQMRVDVQMTPANSVAATALQHPRVAAALQAIVPSTMSQPRPKPRGDRVPARSTISTFTRRLNMLLRGGRMRSFSWAKRPTSMRPVCHRPARSFVGGSPTSIGRSTANGC
jgi:hypothetical protein